MESGTELLGVTTAIVSAFQTAADTLEIIKDRKERKKRKRDKDIEELLEIRILHKSLVEGGTRCRKHCENRHQQFSPSFEAGDDIALLALKDVVISLQTEVIQPLQIARAVENAVLDFTTLHESSITNRRDATRAMDQFCQRIMASMHFQPQQGSAMPEGRLRSDSSIRSSFTNMPIADLKDSYDYPSSPPTSVASPRQPSYTPITPQSAQNTRRPSERVSEIGNYHAPQAFTVPSINSQSHYPRASSTVEYAASSTAGDEQESHVRPVDSRHEQRTQFSIHFSALGSDGSPVLPSFETAAETKLQPLPESIDRVQTASEGLLKEVSASQNTHVSEDTPLPQDLQFSEDSKSTDNSQPPEDAQSSPESELPQYSQSMQQPEAETVSVDRSTTITATYGQENRESFDGGDDAVSLFAPSNTAKQDIQSLPRIETLENMPKEVVSADFAGMHTISPRHDPFSEKYLASLTQADYQERLLSLPAGLDNIWVPLKRPAMHNRYHGFCKGAWQIRRSAHDGLEVKLTETSKEPIIHWTCKECKFQSKAPNADSLPNQILFNQKYGVRYRWLFLAKSHRDAESSSDNPENYKYGCIFCAAQGQPTIAYEKLEHLLIHIVSKHKTAMITPEVKAKTKCIIGSAANQKEDWDIVVPESPQRGAGMLADEFFVSAAKFFSRRKGKRSGTKA